MSAEMQGLTAKIQFKTTPAMKEAMDRKAAELKLTRAEIYRFACVLFLNHDFTYTPTPALGGQAYPNYERRDHEPSPNETAPDGQTSGAITSQNNSAGLYTSIIHRVRRGVNPNRSI